ncbi:MAG: hypothetical protein ACAI43_07720, partial [Phycisphaerae bacterium]|nr:hypothetical protein [Tepidisphaeraceae bacterium]
MSPTRKLVLAISGVAAVAMLIASIALLVWVLQPRPAPTDTGAAAGRRDATTAPVASTNNPDSARPAAAKAGPRVTLRLGQGFRFADGAKLGGTDENCDVAFRYQPPRAGGLGMQYNTSSREFEPKFQSTLDAPFPLLVAAHAKEFESPPDVSKVTTGDVAAFPQQAALYSKARYAVLQTRTGEHYLLTLGEIEAGPRKLEDWRVGFDYERLTLPLGAAGGRVNQPLPGRLVFRDWYRTKMVVRVDLTTGAEDAVADGVVPSVGGDGLLGLFDSAGSYVVRDPAGKVARTTRFDERLWHAALSPDGTRLLATVSRAGPPVPIGFVAVAGPSVTGLAA